MDEESILKSLTLKGDGTLKDLNGLSKCGKIFLYSCVHLLLKPPELEPHKHKNTQNTYKFLSENQNLSVSKAEVLDILANFVDSKGYLNNNKKKRVISLINLHIESNSDTKENKNPRKEEPQKEEEDWLRAYKSQCEKGKHSKTQMATILGMNDSTFRCKLSRLGEEIKIEYIGSENCQ